MSVGRSGWIRHACIAFRLSEIRSRPVLIKSSSLLVSISSVVRKGDPGRLLMRITHLAAGLYANGLAQQVCVRACVGDSARHVLRNWKMVFSSFMQEIKSDWIDCSCLQVGFSNVEEKRINVF